MKLTFMGAGSTVFARNVVGDTMMAEPFHDMEVALYDIDGQRLEESYTIISAMNDTVNEVYVVSIDEMDEIFTEGYGIQVTKGAMSTTFPNIRNTREPQAKYDAKTGDLWLTSSAMEGTGVRLEWLYQIRFGENELAYIKTEVNPYDVQQALLQRLGYTIEGETITLFDGDKQLATVTNTIKDMGGFDDEQPLWIGEQLYYDVSGDMPKVIFTPGVKFTTGLVLTYDDMPELSAPISIDENGQFTIHEIAIENQ
jgi:hypothetical protein